MRHSSSWMCVALFLSLSLSLGVYFSLCSITFNLVPRVFCTDVVFVSLAFINCWPVGLKKSTISNSFFLASLKKPKEKLFARVADQLLVLLFFPCVCGFNCWVYHFKFKRKERNEFTFIRLDTLLLATSRPFFPTFFSLENSFPQKIAFISFSFLDHYLTILYFARIFGHVWIVTVAKHRDFIAIVLILIRVFSGSILRKTEKIDN